jgi:hypothetical protein
MAVLLAGCASLQDKNAPLQKPAVAVQRNQAEDLLKYAQMFAAMPIEAQKKEIARLTKEKTELGRMQLTLALGLPVSRYRDIPRALALLDEELKDSATKDSDLRNLAVLLKALLTDRQKLDEGLQQQVQKLKDEQKHVYDLQQKLEDLKNLEKMMNQERPK